MAFSPETYALLLKMIEEGGGGGGGGAVIITDNGTALDKTFAEIYNLVLSGTPCYISYTGDKSASDLDSDYVYSVMLLPIVKVFKYNDAYRVYASSSSYVYGEYAGTPEIWSYSATSANAYPVFYMKVLTGNQYCHDNPDRV